MVSIKKRYIRILLGFFIPLLIMYVLIILELYFTNEPLSKILLFFFYAPFILSIPLLIYSLLMDLWVIPKFYQCTWCISFISMKYALVLLFLPLFIGGDSIVNIHIELNILLQVVSTGLLSGYILKKTYVFKL